MCCELIKTCFGQAGRPTGCLWCKGTYTIQIVMGKHKNTCFIDMPLNDWNWKCLITQSN